MIDRPVRSRRLTAPRLVFGFAAAGLAAAAAFFVGRTVSDSATQLASLSVSELLLLLPAAVLMTLAVVGFAVTWDATVAWLQGGKSGNGRLIRFFLLSWPARYVPGTVPYHATRLIVAERLGATRLAATTSIAYEALLQLAAGAFLGVLSGVAALGLANTEGSLYLVAMLPFAGLPLALHPRILTPVANRLLRLARRQPLREGALLSIKQTLAVFLAYSVSHLMNGLAFFVVLVSLTDTSVNPLLAISAFSLAGAAGMAAIFVPGGLGVREAVIVAVLSTSVASEEAILVAATSRAVSILADLLPLAAIALFEVATRMRRGPIDVDEAPLQEHRPAA